MLKKAIFLSLFAFAFVTSASAAINPTAAQDLRQDGDGCYAIGTKEELYGFASLVNSGSSTPETCAKLTANIVVNENLLDENGDLNVEDPSDLDVWDPMGIYNESSKRYVPFQGSFDGQGHYISGLYFKEKFPGGLFGWVVGASSKVTVKNVGIVDSYLHGSSVGAIVGLAQVNVDIIDCYNESTITGYSELGGIVGDVRGPVNIIGSHNKGRIYSNGSMAGGLIAYAEGGSVISIQNSYNQGDVYSTYDGSDAGGLCGYCLGTLNVVNAYNVGAVSAGGGRVGGIVGSTGSGTFTNVYNLGALSFSDNGTGNLGKLIGSDHSIVITNSYVLKGGNGRIDGTAVPASAFANGTVATALHNAENGSIWGQNVAAGDKYPNFSGSIVKPELVLTWDEASEEVNIADLEIPAEATSIAIEDGKQFYANGKIYEGELTAEDIQELKTASATLKPISGVALAKDGDGEGVVATLSGSKSTDELVVPEDITVEHIEIARNFTAGRFSTLMLPFSMDLNEDMEDVLQITDVQKKGDQWVATGTSAKSIVANTPYLIKFNKNASISVDNVTLKATTGEIMESTSGPWTFRGAYKGKTWVEGDPELGKVYGFAGVNEGDNIVAGQFVKAGVGASVPPMRAYLVYNKPVVSPKPGVGLMKAAANEAEELPKTIVVRIVDDNNEVVDETVIEDVIQGIAGDNLNTADKKPARWYDLQGRHLNGKPTARGAYIKNNKAIVNK